MNRKTTNRGGAFVRGSALSAMALLGASVGTAAILSSPAAAQDYNNVVASGRVQGTDGNAIAGATVTFTSNGQGFAQSITTDNSGAFRIAQIPSGSYTVSVTAEGYETFTDSAVSLTQGSSANQITLAANDASGDEIVVTAGRVQVADFERTTTGSVINVGELATRVPVARDITSVVLLSPGTAQGDSDFNLPANGSGQLPSIGGASVSENAYFLNGLNITQFRNGLGGVTVPFDFYETVEVKNGGFPAEFGRTTGGVINATTKSGTNEFHGGLSFNYEPDSLREKAPNTYAFDNDAGSVERKDVVAQLSGPIIKDHLFFYGIYNARDVQSEFAQSTLGICTANPATCAAYGPTQAIGAGIVPSAFNVDRSTSPFWGGKLDAVAGGHRLEFTYFNTSSVQTRKIYGTAASGRRYNIGTNDPGAYASSTQFRTGGENYVGRYTGKFTDWLTLSLAYGKNNNRSTTESTAPDAPSILDQRAGSASIGNPTANNSTNFDARTFYRGDLDLTFNLFGSHHLRGGYDREDLSETSFTEANGGFQYTYALADGSTATGLPAGTPYVTARTFRSGGAFDTRDEAFYLQDSWSLLNNQLTLQLGVRNDRFENKNAAGTTFYKSGSQWAPRLGFSLDPWGTGETKVYGSFGRYYLPIAVNTNVRLAGAELDFDAYYRLAGLNGDNTPILGAPITTGANFGACPGGVPAVAACVIRNDGSVPATSATVAANLKPQSADEYIFGIEQRMGRGLKFGAYFTQRSLNDSLEDAAIDEGIIAYCVEQGDTPASCRAIWGGVHQYALINPGRDVTIQLSDPLPGETALRTVTLSAADLGYPAAKRRYRSMTVTFDREFDGVWSLSGSYTFSKLRGNIEGGVRSDNAQTDAGLTTAFDLPSLTYGAYGYLPGDRRHNFKLYGSYKIADWLTVGANASVESPRKYGCLGRVAANADANLGGRFYNAAGFYCNLDASGKVVTNPVGYTVVNPTTPGYSSLQLTPRGSQFQSDWISTINVDAALKVPSDQFDATFRVSVFNLLNSQAKTDFQEQGTTQSGAPRPDYGQVQRYQTPRFVRFQLGLAF